MSKPTRHAPRPMVMMLTLALGFLLVGLSAAHTTLPGDTFQVTPRATVGHAVSATLPGDPESQPLPGGLLAILPIAVVFAIGGLALARARHRVALIPARIPPAAGCRGPPSSTTH